jgi:hypothetical protein
MIPGLNAATCSDAPDVALLARRSTPAGAEPDRSIRPYCRSIVPCPLTMILVTGRRRQSPSSGSTSSKPPPKPSPEKPLPDSPIRLNENVKTFDRLPGPDAVGKVNEKRPHHHRRSRCRDPSAMGAGSTSPAATTRTITRLGRLPMPAP